MEPKGTEKEYDNNKRLVTRQKEGTFKAWQSIQNFQNGVGLNLQNKVFGIKGK